MDKFSKLIVLTEQESQHSLTMLARTAGIDVTQQRKFDIVYGSNTTTDTLLACPYHSLDWNKQGLSADLQYLRQKSALFLFQAERRLVNPIQALNQGVRGVIFRDEQPDRVLTALKTMMDGQLYYARSVMSELVDQLLQEKLTNDNKQLTLSANNILTRQEKRIIELVAEGARNKEIALNLQISANTVKVHLSSVFRKTQVRNRVELIRWLQQSAAQPPSAPLNAG
jgi:LuxR family transcriptional regulator, positive regulator of biofilm formation